MTRGIAIVALSLMTLTGAAVAPDPQICCPAPSTAVKPETDVGDGRLFQAGAILSVSSQVPVEAVCGTRNPHVVGIPETDVRPSEGDATQAVSSQARAADCGIEPLSLRLTANGYLLDFRFRVLDVEKASPLFEHRTKPWLQDIETGVKLIVPTPPKIGALRTSRQPKPGTVSFMLFANPGKLIQPGKQMALIAGDCRVDNLTVE